MGRRSRKSGGPAKRRRTTSLSARKKPFSAADLRQQLEQRARELDEARAQQIATSEVLNLIRRSPADAQPVFDAIVESAARLCGAIFSVVYLYEAGRLHIAATRNFTAKAASQIYDRQELKEPHRSNLGGRAILDRAVVHIPDVLSDPEYSREFALAGGWRAVLAVPLLHDGNPAGAITVGKTDPAAFSEQQVQLLKTFADQAVIAIENVRLFDEVQAKTRDLQEALTYQTGSANILSVIASSPTDVGPVLKAIVESACELCDAYDATVLLRVGDDLRYSEHHGPIPIGLDSWPINRNYAAGRSVVDKVPVHVSDFLSAEASEFPEGQEMSRRMGHRCVLSVPLLREGESVGAIALRRLEAHPFSDKQIALLQTFADQAVIAIQNSRLFNATKEALEQQQASGEVLSVIASSVADTTPVFDRILDSCERLVAFERAAIFVVDADEQVQLATGRGHSGETPAEALRAVFPQPVDRTPMHRAFSEGRVVVFRDVGNDRDAPWTLRAAAANLGSFSVVVAPMLWEGRGIGAIHLSRAANATFTEKEVALLKTFADQAVIAIQNARLFEEVQAKTRDLTESLQQQTATADVLKVINRSTFDLPAVLQTLVESAARLCDADNTNITREKNGVFYRAEAYGFSPEFQEYVKDVPIQAGKGSAFGRALLEGRVVHIPDVLADPVYTYLEGQRLGGYRTVLTVPMLREGAPIGVLTLSRSEVRPFSDKHVELATTFADQAAIAIENVRLFESVEARTRELAKSLDDLRTAQDRLIQTEKLASLGQLTAGIAHEIKNPLNFVNNFAALSAELTDELNDVLKLAEISGKMRQEVDELTGLLKDNLEKVVQHGKRADSIVKNMLQHSREGSGEHRPADINAIVDESLNLAYHGARAEKSGFSITFQRDLDPSVGMADVYPQEITRVLLNLISNGFYATMKRKAEAGDGFEPMLSAATKNLGDKVEIRIRDNGTGIPEVVKEKIFNPFFTTKPSGEGTGLGLSMSHDIIVKQHGGSIDVETEPGLFTEFKIVLPRTNQR